MMRTVSMLATALLVATLVTVTAVERPRYLSWSAKEAERIGRSDPVFDESVKDAELVVRIHGKEGRVGWRVPESARGQVPRSLD